MLRSEIELQQQRRKGSRWGDCLCVCLYVRLGVGLALVDGFVVLRGPAGTADERRKQRGATVRACALCVPVGIVLR